MPPVEYLPNARLDFDESFDWYAVKSVRAAARFAGAVEAALIRIVSNPTQFARLDEMHRECPVKNFPYRIVYRITDNRILVVAIAHAKRRPGYWRRF